MKRLIRTCLPERGVGGPGVTRTRNTSLRRRMLYPIELRDRDSFDSGSDDGSQRLPPLLACCYFIRFLT